MVDPNRKINRLTEKDLEFLDECEEEFKDRFTENDEEFVLHCKQEVPPPPIIDPWSARTFNSPDGRRGRGGGGSGRGNFRGNNNRHYNDRRGNHSGYDHHNNNRQNNYRSKPYDRNDGYSRFGRNNRD